MVAIESEEKKRKASEHSYRCMVKKKNKYAHIERCRVNQTINNSSVVKLLEIGVYVNMPSWG